MEDNTPEEKKSVKELCQKFSTTNNASTSNILIEENAHEEQLSFKEKLEKFSTTNNASNGNPKKSTSQKTSSKW